MVVHQIKVECQRPRCKRWRWHTIMEDNNARCEVCDYRVYIQPSLLMGLAAKLGNSPYYRAYDLSTDQVLSWAMADSIEVSFV